jgi:hypothetical protein
MLKLHLTRADDYEGVYLQLPATSAEFEEVCSWLDEISTDITSTRIKGAISDVWNIGTYLKNTDINTPGQLDKLNRITEIIGMMDRDECHTFEGALDAESINGLEDIIAIGEQLDRYLYIPHVTTHQELGLFLVNHDIKPFDDGVCPYLDYSKIGIEYYSNHGGACTAKGYIVRRDSVEQALVDAVDNRSSQRMEGMKMA